MTPCPACGYQIHGLPDDVWHHNCVQRVFTAARLHGVSVGAICDALGVALDELRERGLWPAPQASDSLGTCARCAKNAGENR